LVIVDETSSGEHVGFWVPCCPGEKQLYLPGAPRAFMTAESSSVYKDDLPPLDGFSDKLGSSWQAYITNNLKEDMFVSIPLVVLSEEHTAGKQSVAVMNLNVKGRDQSPLSRRAYHQEWLLVAAEKAKPFLEVSYWCTVIKLNASKMVDRKNYLDLETGLIDWNGIPGIELKEMDG
jgi:hypothetical protein